MPAQHCTATTKKGTPCTRPRIDGQDVCIAHASKEVRASRGFGGVQPGGGRPAAPRVVDVIRERIEQEIDDWYQVLLDARDAEKAVTIGYGEHAHMELVPDYALRLAAFREAMDRAYGRPKQQTEVSGPGGGPIDLRGLSDDELRATAAELRARRQT